MIHGIGSDIVDIRRIEHLLERFGGRFITKHFTAQEIALAETLGKKSAASLTSYYATRFAAKEACAKALGCGIGAHAGWQDMEILRISGQRPVLRLTPRIYKYLRQSESTVSTHLSLSDEYPYAQAFVIIELAPPPA